jgi:hypothetical protein
VVVAVLLFVGVIESAGSHVSVLNERCLVDRAARIAATARSP